MSGLTRKSNKKQKPKPTGESAKDQKLEKDKEPKPKKENDGKKWFKGKFKFSFGFLSRPASPATSTQQRSQSVITVIGPPQKPLPSLPTTLSPRPISLPSSLALSSRTSSPPSSTVSSSTSNSSASSPSVASSSSVSLAPTPLSLSSAPSTSTSTAGTPDRSLATTPDLVPVELSPPPALPPLEPQPSRPPSRHQRSRSDSEASNHSIHEHSTNHVTLPTDTISDGLGGKDDDDKIEGDEERIPEPLPVTRHASVSISLVKAVGKLKSKRETHYQTIIANANTALDTQLAQSWKKVPFVEDSIEMLESLKVKLNKSDDKAIRTYTEKVELLALWDLHKWKIDNSTNTDNDSKTSPSDLRIAQFRKSMGNDADDSTINFSDLIANFDKELRDNLARNKNIIIQDLGKKYEENPIKDHIVTLINAYIDHIVPAIIRENFPKKAKPTTKTSAHPSAKGGTDGEKYAADPENFIKPNQEAGDNAHQATNKKQTVSLVVK